MKKQCRPYEVLSLNTVYFLGENINGYPTYMKIHGSVCFAEIASISNCVHFYGRNFYKEVN